MTTEPTTLASSSSASSSSCRVIGSRVDWLEIAYKVALAPAALVAIAEACDQARKVEPKTDGAAATKRRKSAALVIGSLVAEAKPMGGAGAVALKSGEFHATIDPSSRGGWAFVLRWSAMTLARTPLEELLERGARLARELGQVEELGEVERVRRLDLAVDFAGWEITRSDADKLLEGKNLVGRALRAYGRGSLTNMLEGGADPECLEEPLEELEEGGTQPDRRVYVSGNECTGVTVCAGSPLMARIYNKAVELDLPHNAEKKLEELARVTARGYREGEAWTRVEFQFRSDVLGEFRAPGGEGVEGHDVATSSGVRACQCGPCRERRKDPLRTARNPRNAVRMLDVLFSYASTQWLRMVIPEARTRLSRCPLDPRWELLRAVTFAHDAIAGVRRRHRAGAGVWNAYGTMLSYLGARGLLPRLKMHELCYSEEAEAESAIRTVLQAHFALACETMTTEVLGKRRELHELRELLEQLEAKNNQAWSRFYVEERTDRRVLPPPEPHTPEWLTHRYSDFEERAAIAAAE